MWCRRFRNSDGGFACSVRPGLVPGIRALISLVLTMRDRRVACCPCFETLASLAPQHEVVVFQQVRPHPEEATKWPSRRMGCSSPAPPVLPDFFADQAG